MRGRGIGIITILLLAPITAELLQAYLGDLGGPGALIFTVLFFAPLYGGAALLIREVSVRTGRGWPARLWLGAAFGVAMTAVIDVSLFTPVRDDVEGWDAILGAASWGGIGWSAVVTWVGGHVLFSIAAPIVIGEALAQRPGPWLGRVAMVVVGLAFVAVAVSIHQDQAASYPNTAGPAEYAASAAVVLALVAVAFTPLGRPVTRREAGNVPPVAGCAVIGVVATAIFDLVPLSWLGVGIDLAVLVVVGALVLRWSRSPGWTMRHVAALTFGAVLMRTLIGFLAPLPVQTTWPEKLGQNIAYLLLMLALGWAMERRTRTSAAASARPRAQH